jgi:hypothetical protein
MYITAQRVRNRSGKTGINSFLYVHTDTQLQGIEWTEAGLLDIADNNLGDLVAEVVEVPPGGNSVLSYIDVACPNNASLKGITATTDGLAKNAIEGRPFFSTHGDVVARMYIQPGLGVSLAFEVQALVTHLIKTATDRPEPTWKGKEPLIVMVRIDAERSVYFLDDKSKSRVAGHRKVELPFGIVNIDHDTQDMFDELHGDITKHAIPLVCGMDLEEIASMGGVVVVNDYTGDLVWQWPKRKE